jgi:hypothetical protein
MVGKNGAKLLKKRKKQPESIFYFATLIVQLKQGTIIYPTPKKTTSLATIVYTNFH